MAEIVVAITDYKDRRSAQLLENSIPVRTITTQLAERLQLYRKLNYELVPAIPGAKPLKDSQTLTKCGVVAGSELLIRPVRDSNLKDFLEKLYDEVEGHIKDQLTDLATEKLKEIFHLDPSHPDPLGFKQMLEKGFAHTPVQPQPLQHAASHQQAAPPKKSGCNPGCIVGAALGGGVVFLGGVLLVAVLFSSILKPAEPYQPPEAVAPEIYVQPAAPANPQLPAESYATEIVLGTGDVQITLRWNSDADLDLHVIDPYQEELWYGHSFAQSGGELDVDANAGCASTMPSPVENVFWQFGGAPGGVYKVNVVYFMNCNYSGPVEYEVVIRLDGNIYGTYPGTIYEAGDVQFITEFSR